MKRQCVFLILLCAALLGCAVAQGDSGAWSHYFKESPSLPLPSDIVPLTLSDSQEGGIYLFKPDTDGQTGKELAQAYLEELKGSGFQVKNYPRFSFVNIGNTKIATVSVLGDTVKITLSQPEGITFQNIPWGASPDQVKRYLEASGMVDRKGYWYNQSDGLPCFWPGEGADAVDKTADALLWGMLQTSEKGRITEVYRENIVKTVAGYDGISLTFSFSYGITDGEIDKTVLRLETVAVDFVHYLAENGKTDKVYGDLTEKLNKAYGKYAVNHNKRSGKACRIWRGEGNTAILLTEEISWMGDEIFILYADTESAAREAELTRILEKTTPKKYDAGL